MKAEYRKGCLQRDSVEREEYAGARSIDTRRAYLENKLKLKLNAQKSKVVSVFARKHFKFLGFALGKNGNGVYIRAHPQSLRKAKKRLKELTKRSQGRNVRRVIKDVKVYIRGWLNHFYVAEIKRILQSWNEWLRRRFFANCT